MLNFADRPYRYYPPKPNWLVHRIGCWLNRSRYLPGEQHLISSVSVVNPEVVRNLKGARLLFLPNHSTHSDAQIIIETLRQVGVWSFCMAAYDVFERNALHAWVIQRMGGFSVDRDGSDKQSLKQAIATLGGSRQALTIFPEGNVLLMNDRVTPFLDGPAYIALKAQQQLGEGSPVLAVPVAIKATHTGDVRAKLQETLSEMASVLDADFKEDEPIVSAVYQVGLAMLRRNLRQRGFMPPDADWDDLPGVLHGAAGLVIEGLEAKMELSSKSDDQVDRIRAIRREVHRIRTDPVREIDHPVASSWADEAITAFRILSYAGNYLAEKPTLDRCGETIEKLREDLYGRMFPAYAERAVRVRFGQPIDVSAKVAAGGKPRELIADLTDAFEQSVQTELDNLSADNPHPGAQLF